MPRNRGHQSHPSKGKQNPAPSSPAQSHEDRRPADFDKVGPLSIEGVEASDLPDKGRGDIFTDISKEAGRKLPQQIGNMGDGQLSLSDPDIAEAAKSDGRRWRG